MEHNRWQVMTSFNEQYNRFDTNLRYVADIGLMRKTRFLMADQHVVLLAASIVVMSQVVIQQLSSGTKSHHFMTPAVVTMWCCCCESSLGCYEITSPTWALAHTTQVANPGWRYMLHNNGVSLLATGGSLVTRMSPDFLVVSEKMTTENSDLRVETTLLWLCLVKTSS